MNHKLITVGNITLDDTVLPTGQTYMSACGGDALYSALGASFWLPSVGMVTRTGDDFPLEHMEACESIGIDTAGMILYPGPTIRNWVIYEDDGRRHFIYRTKPERLDELSPEPFEMPNSYQGAPVIHIAAMPIDVQERWVDFAYEVGAIVTLDPHEEYVKGYKPQLKRMLAKINVFLPSEEEVRRWFGNDSWEEHVRVLAGFGPSFIVIKRGENGSLLYIKETDKFLHIPAYPCHVQDTTGAGDAFCGGFAAGLSLTGDCIEGVLRGTVSASLAIEKFGALHLFQYTKESAGDRLVKLRSLVEITQKERERL
jgi:ribokinase